MGVLRLTGIRSLAEYRKEVGAMAAIAVIGVLVLAAAAVYFFPTSSGTNVPSPPRSVMTSITQTFLGSTTASPETETLPTTETTLYPTIESTISTYYSISLSTSPSPGVNTITTPGPSPPQWDAGPTVNLTLYSPVVQTFVRDAYSYVVECCTSSSPPPDETSSIYLTIYVIGSQAVSGDWTTEYAVTQSGVEALAATVRYTEPDSYQLASVNATSLPGRNYTINYTALQQGVIRAALANNTVSSDIVSDGLSPYYVGNVTAFPSVNGTYGGDYFLTFLQADGPRYIGVYVNSTTMQVTKLYEDSFATSMCYYPGDFCFSSPWGSLPEPSMTSTNVTLITLITISPTSTGGNYSSAVTTQSEGD